MRIFFGASSGRADVPCDSPAEASLETALEVFAGLDARKGFLGIILDAQQKYCLQLMPEKTGVRVELVDSSIPALDACVADAPFVETLIRAAAAGQDVFALARAGHQEWKHTSLA